MIRLIGCMKARIPTLLRLRPLIPVDFPQTLPQSRVNVSSLRAQAGSLGRKPERLEPLSRDVAHDGNVLCVGVTIIGPAVQPLNTSVVPG